MYSPSLDFEKQYWEKNILVVGIDEAGRGALAGPVVVAGVIFPLNFKPNFQVFDSKEIRSPKREEIYQHIISNSINYSIKMKFPEDIDKTNILRATIEAMNEILLELIELQPFALIDGNRYDGKFPAKTIIDGDAKCFSIAAASVVAKVHRDRWMCNVAHKLYPQYGFDRHKGYGTKQHIENILKYNPSPLHRLSFIKKILNKQYDIFT